MCKNKYIITKNDSNSYETILINDDIEKIIEQYKKNIIKLDEIIDEKNININQLSDIILYNKKNFFPYGIKIKDIYLLCEELTIYQIIDYKNNNISISRLNLLLDKKGIEQRIDIIENITIFQTRSYLYTKNNLEKLYFCNGFHTIDRTQSQDISNCIRKSSKVLLNMQLNTGKFLYGVNARTGEIDNKYSLLRHVGSLWSLVVTHDYNENKYLKNKIDKGIEYVMQFVINFGSCSYLINDKYEKYILGGNGLLLLLLSDYEKIFKDDHYHEVAEKIANGILKMQMPNGRFNHVLNKNLGINKKFVISYYDGEAVFGLIKFYQISQKKIYLDAVVDAFNYFIKKNYGKYSDHWISHTLRELIKILPKEKYILFAISNYKKNERNVFRPTRLESDIALYEVYQYIKIKKINNIIDQFPIEDLKKNIKHNLEMDMSYYIGEEKAIYTENPNLVTNGFWTEDDNFRMRIDDIQHAIVGLYYYNISDLSN